MVRHKTSHCFVQFDPDQQTVKKLLAFLSERGLEAKVDPKAKWPKKPSKSP